MLLRYGLGLEEAADWVDKAISKAIDAGEVTADLGGDLSTTEAIEALEHHLHLRSSAHHCCMAI